MRRHTSGFVSERTIRNSCPRLRPRRAFAYAGVRSRLPRERRAAQAELERLQEAIERVLRRVVARIDCTQHVRAGHAHLSRELRAAQAPVSTSSTRRRAAGSLTRRTSSHCALGRRRPNGTLRDARARAQRSYGRRLSSVTVIVDRGEIVRVARSARNQRMKAGVPDPVAPAVAVRSLVNRSMASLT